MAKGQSGEYWQELFERYPWYSLGYFDAYHQICQIDSEGDQLFLERAAAKLNRREPLYSLSLEAQRLKREEEVVEVPIEKLEVEQEEVVTEKSRVEVDESKVEEIELDLDIELASLQSDSPQGGRVVFAGGDYFSPEELKSLSLNKGEPIDNFIAERPSILRSSLLARDAVFEPDKGEEIDLDYIFEDSQFYTEKLAEIYSEQGLYKQALDVYGKLILLYPEKSDYFASLVKEIKLKHN